MNTKDILIIGTIIVYLILMVVIGLIVSKKNNNVGDFYLGGRKLGPLVTAMSAEASDMSSYFRELHTSQAVLRQAGQLLVLQSVHTSTGLLLQNDSEFTASNAMQSPFLISFQSVIMIKARYLWEFQL